MKILAIGDSYTGGFYASNDDSWFGILQKNSNGRFDVHAYGIVGAGTTQQYIAFSRLKDAIKPDILLIQYCTNDPANDSFEYGKGSLLRNQSARRPYCKSGTFYFRNDIPSRAFRFAYKSYIFQRLDVALQVAQNRYYKFVRNPAQVSQDLSHWEDVYTQYVRFAKKSGIKEIWTISCSPTKAKSTRWK